MSAGRTGRRTVLSVQYLRAYAAVSIVLYHSAVHAGIGNRWPVPGLSSGVDIFFPISGFIMWVTTHRQQLTWRTFIVKRVTRVVPLYWLLSIVAVGISLVAPSLAGSTDVLNSATSFLFLPNTNPATHRVEPVISVGWTLNYEMFFYALFAASLLLTPKARLRWLPATLLALTLAGTLIHGPLAARFYTNSIILEFGFGILVGAMYTSGYTLPTPVSAILAVGAFSVIFVGGGLHWAVARALLWGLPGTTLLAAATLSERRRSWRLYPYPLLVGDASYSLYIVHGFVLSSLAVLLRHAGAPKISMLIVGPVVAIPVGVFTYRWVEQKLTAWLKRTDPPQARRPP